MDTDALIAEYIELRDAKAQLKKQWSEDNEKIDRRLNQIEAEFLNKFNTENSESAKAASGIAFKTTRTTAKVVDRDSWLRDIIENENYQFIESKANKTAVDQYIAEHGEPPPGVNIVTETTVNIRRA